jgi:hypothetical protein
MAIGESLRDPKPKPVPPNYGVFSFSKLFNRNSASKALLSQNTIIYIIFSKKVTLSGSK